MSNVAFIIGHTPIKKGLKSSYFKKHEFSFWYGLADALKELGQVHYHTNLFGYTTRQKAMSKETRFYDLVFELHFNGSKDSDVEGCEAWYYHKNKRTRKLAGLFCKEYTKRSGTRNRGAKSLYNNKQRGFGFVYYQSPDAILLEPFFGDNDFDCSKFNIDKFIDSLKVVIEEHKKPRC